MKKIQEGSGWRRHKPQAPMISSIWADLVVKTKEA
jgi:hypothetical protein